MSRTTYLASILVSLFFLMACQSKTENRSLYKSENIESLNEMIQADTSIQTDPHKIALKYYGQLYPSYHSENLNVKMEFKDEFLYVELMEELKDDPGKDAIKVILVFNRPMGVHRVNQIKHSWKCKNRPVFSGEDCTP